LSSLEPAPPAVVVFLVVGLMIPTCGVTEKY